PSASPAISPSHLPTTPILSFHLPTIQPSNHPTIQPSNHPTIHPIFQLSNHPLPCSYFPLATSFCIPLPSIGTTHQKA
ncbi:hypothetical protein BJ684DRAFT_12510, partial [Piptocephalis cylindrospora]